MIGYEEATQQAKALLAAAEASPVRQFRYEMRRRGKEWERAARDLELASAGGEDAVIELAGGVVAGMFVPTGDDEERGGLWFPVLRSFESRGQWSIHWQDWLGKDRYINFFAASSPVVVKA